MLLSQFSKINPSSLFTINTSMVWLLIILQLTVWYPFLSDEKKHLEKQQKRRDRAFTAWQEIQKQSDVIENGQVLTPSFLWAEQKIGEKHQGVLTQWHIEGSALINDWQTLLEGIQEQFSLGLMSAYWERKEGGKWFGRLSFDIQPLKANRAYDNWLPTTLRAERLAETDWRLLSTMRDGEKVSALLEHKNSQHWVRQGSWLPAAGLTVAVVSFDQVTLMAKDGRQMALTIGVLTGKPLGEEHD